MFNLHRLTAQHFFQRRVDVGHRSPVRLYSQLVNWPALRWRHYCVNLRNNKYGSGSYFARDPRLAHYFVRGARSISGGRSKMILARVVVGWCAKKQAVRSARDLTKREHREAPNGFHSCTSWDSPGREIVVFPGSPGSPVFPAYVLTYKTPWQGDPYSPSAHLIHMNGSTTGWSECKELLVGQGGGHQARRPISL